ncbi:MAG TPA: ABC transporter permease [Xanthobacteraceae bacterium]|jgi:lipoprotein-releasing system permease protein
MNLIFNIAWTHVRTRARQTLIAGFGVATGVGFSIMMASLMEGSQDDFVKTLVNVLPHVTVSDERNKPTLQPAEVRYAAAEIHGLTPEVRRRGIKNPMASIAALEAWVPGKLTPSVTSKGLLRYAGRDVAVSITGIDPRTEGKVSNLETQMRQGELSALYRATNAIILGDRLADKLAAKVGANVTISGSRNVRINGTVVGTFHSGVRQVDDGAAYVLIKTGQILEGQTGLVNEFRVRLTDPMVARSVAARIAAETGYKSVSWEEAQEDLLSAFQVRNIIMFTVVGAILLVASFGTYNIISTITHEKSRDIAIMKSLGLNERTVRRIFVIEAMAIGLAGAVVGSVLGYFMCIGLGTIEIKTPFVDATRLPLKYTINHYVIAAGVALFSSVVAGYFPARKAARVHPVEIIRGAT